MQTSEQQSQQLALALKGAKSGLWDWNIPEERISFGPNYYRIAGYEPDEFPHHLEEWEKRVHPDDIATAKKTIQQYMAGELDHYSVEFRFKTKSGIWMWILGQGEITERDETGTPTRFIGLHIDITQSKKTEKAFQEERRFSTSLVDTAHMIVMILDVKGRIRRINSYMEEISGYKEVEVKGKDWFGTFLPPADNAKIRAIFKKDIGEIGVSSHINSILTKDGREITIEWYNKVLKDVDGATAGVLSLGVDITEKRAMEETLRVSEEKYRSLYDNAPLPYQSLDPEGCFLDINPAWLKTLGYRRNEVIGKYYGDFLHPDWKAHFELNFPAFKKRGYVHDVQFKIRHKDGHYIDISFEGCIAYTPDGQIKHTYCVFQDITERKVVEDKLAHQQNLLEKAQKLGQIGSWEYDADQNVFIGTEVSNQIYGIPNGYKAKYKMFLKRSHPDDRNYVDQNWSDALKSGILSIEHRIIVNSSVKWVREKAEMKFDNNGEVIGGIGFTQDITERVKAEADREELENQLRQKHKMEAVGYMAGGMAHNFNNNLSIILGNVELSQLKVQDPKIQELLKNAKTAILRSRDLVSQIITYSRKGIQNKTPMKLLTIADETITLLSSTLPTTINLRKVTSPECNSTFVNADASQIQEILVNLCNNAVQAMDEKGELTISLEPVELSQAEIPAQYDGIPGRYAKMSVQDTGCGMSAEMVDKIFDPFFSTKEMHEGTGMGLATVQGIVAQHGGIIKVNSIPDQGTVFNLYFPIVEDTATEPKSINEDMPKGTEKILFIDDDEMLAELGELTLSEMGYTVTTMTDSTEALKLFTANPDHFDLVITDQTMPDLTGKDLIQELKKTRPDLRTILCTGFSSKIDENLAKQQGIDAFCMKPLDLPEMLQTVRRVLDGDKE